LIVQANNGEGFEMATPSIEQRCATLLSNLEAAIKHSDPASTNHMLLLPMRELAEIVKELAKKGG
jgi:hypothetical protein